MLTVCSRRKAMVAALSTAAVVGSCEKQPPPHAPTNNELTHRLPLLTEKIPHVIATQGGNITRDLTRMEEAVRKLYAPPADAYGKSFPSPQELIQALQHYGATSQAALSEAGKAPLQLKQVTEKLLTCEKQRTGLRSLLLKAACASPDFQQVVTVFLGREEIDWSTCQFEMVDLSSVKPTFEYKDPLARITIAMPAVELERSPDTVRTQAMILAALPEYTRVSVLIPAGGRAVAEKLLSDALRRISNFKFDLTRIDWVESEPGPFNEWCQDFSEGGPGLQYVSMRLPAPCDVIPDAFLAGRSCVVASPYLKDGVVQLPVFFDGGNVTPAEDRNGRSVLLVGSSEPVNTTELYSKWGINCPTGFFEDTMQRAFGVDGVTIVGPSLNGKLIRQSRDLFHLDRAVMPIGAGELAFLTPQKPESLLDPASEQRRFEAARDAFETRWNAKLGITLRRSAHPFPERFKYLNEGLEESREFLSEFIAVLKIADDVRYQLKWPALDTELRQMRSQLTGFKLLDFECTLADACEGRLPTSMIVFTDRETNKPTAIYPVYDPIDGVGGLSEVDRHNIKLLTARGYEVVVVQDFDAIGRNFQGSIHCLVGRY